MVKWVDGYLVTPTSQNMTIWAVLVKIVFVIFVIVFILCVL